MVEEDLASDVEGGLEMGKEDGMIDGIKSCREVKENEDVQNPRRGGNH